MLNPPGGGRSARPCSQIFSNGAGEHPVVSVSDGVRDFEAMEVPVSDYSDIQR